MGRYRIQGYSTEDANKVGQPVPLSASNKVQIQWIDDDHLVRTWVDVTPLYRADPGAVQRMLVYLQDETNAAADRARKALQAEIRHSLGIEE